MNPTEYSTINPLNDPHWDERLASSGSQCIFHTQAWASVLAESYHHLPLYLTRSHGHQLDVLVPLMHVDSWATGRRGVSLPFSDYCDWLVPPDELEHIIAALHNLAGQYHWKYIEIRTALPNLQTTASYDSLYHHELDLTPSPGILWNQLKSEVRTSIRKSRAVGMEVRFTHDQADFREFLRLHSLTRQKLGIPPQPTWFFDSLFKHIITTGLGEIGLAQKEGVTHAAAIFLYFGTTALYKYGASDPNLLAARGNNALMWEAILKAARNGFSRLSMGRTALSHRGLRRFKLGWGCRESPLDYFRHDYQLNQFIPGHPHPAPQLTFMLKHTPLPLLRLAGRLIYPHLS